MKAAFFANTAGFLVKTDFTFQAIDQGVVNGKWPKTVNIMKAVAGEWQNEY